MSEISEVTATTEAADRRYMRMALGLARRGLGCVWPNPAVGCVLVRPDGDGRVAGRGWTQPSGRPHAETEALKRAGDSARGATAYVTLEPCAHHGHTPPCADALISAGVSRVVIAIQDPDPRVSGRGIARLEASGVPVTLGILAEEARRLNDGFLLRLLEHRPMVTAKVATSLDGRIATGSGESQWITGPASRDWGHRLRATHDAVLIGIGTAVADDPLLDCRLGGLSGRSPVRVVADTRLRLRVDSQLVRTASKSQVIVLSGPGARSDTRSVLEDYGVRVVEVETDADGTLSPLGMLRSLADMGMTRVLLEGGGKLFAAFLQSDLVDRICWFRAATVLGADGLPAVARLDFDGLADAPEFSRAWAKRTGPDIMEFLERTKGD